MTWSWYGFRGGVADGAATCKTLVDKRAGTDGWPTGQPPNCQTIKPTNENISGRKGAPAQSEVMR